MLTVLTVALVGVEHHIARPPKCPAGELAAQLDDWERRATTNQGLQEVKWEIAPILLGTCNTPRIEDLLYKPEYDPAALNESERTICPGIDVFNHDESDDGNWHTFFNQQYRQCNFARYGLLHNHELNAVEPQGARFWHAVDELIEASVDPDVARRTARLLLLAHDAETRTNDRYVLRRGTLTRTYRYDGGPTVWQLDEEGRLGADIVSELYPGSGVESISLGPEARGRDLAWLFEYCEARHYGCSPVYLASLERTTTGLPIVAAVEVGRRDKHVREREPEPVLTVFMDERGFELRSPGMSAGEVRLWASYDASLAAKVPTTGRVDVVLGPDVRAATFLPGIIALHRHLGLQYPWLRPSRDEDASSAHVSIHDPNPAR
ncbi:hypothetical protein [Enhygromyxa salina]|uniref:hypothetical protein n=1 Tax=Enhygromyxa salina TaxID=215803 RepID=UPI000697844E|nr:hypothetical protein [Enhygromyxa salina]